MHNLSRRHMLGTAAALLAGGLAACGGSGPDSSAPISTTMFVYLLGSDLESEHNAGTDNLLEMLAAKGSAHTRIVITTGGPTRPTRRVWSPAGRPSSASNSRAESSKNWLTWARRTWCGAARCKTL